MSCITKGILAAVVGVGLVAGCSAPDEPETTVQVESRTDELQRAVDALDAVEAARIQEYIANHVDPETIVESVKQGEDIHDCVPELEQPAIRNLRKKGIYIDKLEVPPELPEVQEVEVDTSGERVVLPARMVKPDCPTGTIPIRRPKIEEIAVYGSLEAYFDKPAPSSNNWEYANLVLSSNNMGGRADINIWNPYVSSLGSIVSHSISQIWVGAGCCTAGDENWETVEVGTRRAYGQSKARLFAFHTPDGYDTDCWNYECFVESSGASYTLDAEWSNYSVTNGAQYSVSMEIRTFSTNGGAWFLYVGGTWVGYWPNGNFDGVMDDFAERFDAGGEVAGDNSGAHTFTDMGSGKYASEGWQKAAYVKKIQYRNTSGNLTDFPSWIHTNPTDSNCYSGFDDTSTDSNWKKYLYFGGPGYNYPDCQ